MQVLTARDKDYMAGVSSWVKSDAQYSYVLLRLQKVRGTKKSIEWLPQAIMHLEDFIYHKDYKTREYPGKLVEVTIFI